MTGYTGGFGINLYGTISEFSYDTPLSVRFGGGYNIREAGNPWDARKIFINDNTNGDPAESAHSFDLRLDFAYPVNLFSIRKSLLKLDQDILCIHPHLNLLAAMNFLILQLHNSDLVQDLETYFGISPNLSLVFSGGFDYYFDAQIGGHDSAYNPDGTDVSGREDYTYRRC